jgi:hypothetical protein
LINNLINDIDFFFASADLMLGNSLTLFLISFSTSISLRAFNIQSGPEAITILSQNL